MSFEAYQNNPSAFFAQSIFNLLLTALLYGAGPVLFAIIRKSPVTLRFYRNFCTLYTIFVYLIFSILYLVSGISGVPNMTAAIIWGVIFYRVFRKKFRAKQPDPKTDATAGNPQQIVEVYRSEFRMKNDIPEKRKIGNKTIIMISALCVALLVSIFANVYQLYKAGKQSFEIESMKSDISVYETKTNQLQASYEDAKERADEYEEEASFLNRRIGLIVDGSPYYHSYLCSVFQESDTFWAHNVEYCESLGYEKCPICGFVFD